MRRTIIMGLSMLLLSLGSVGCASTDIRTAQSSRPRESIAAASEAGAREVPKAAYHLKLAEDRLVNAEKLMREGETDRPSIMLQEASADAELALAMARLETTRGKAKSALDAIQKLRAE